MFKRFLVKKELQDGKYSARMTMSEDFERCGRIFLHRCHLSLLRGKEHHIWQVLAEDLVMALRNFTPKDARSEEAKVAWCSGTLEEFMEKIASTNVSLAV